MEIYVDYHSGVPIYQQIQQQLTRQILSGALPPEMPLPSIRSLAKDLRISVITTKRAYEELERSGLIYTMPGKGCFVSRQSHAVLQENHLKEIEAQLRSAAAQARGCGIGREELIAMLKTVLEEET